MNDEDLAKIADAAKTAIDAMADHIAPLAAGAHIGVMTLIDLLREDPSFEAKFQEALKRRLSYYPPAFDAASRIFTTPDANAAPPPPGAH